MRRKTTSNIFFWYLGGQFIENEINKKTYKEEIAKILGSKREERKVHLVPLAKRGSKKCNGTKEISLLKFLVGLQLPNMSTRQKEKDLC